MKCICAWCGVTIWDGGGDEVTHGMCASCMEKMEKETKEYNRKTSEKNADKLALGFTLSMMGIWGAILIGII